MEKATGGVTKVQAVVGAVFLAVVAVVVVATGVAGLVFGAYGCGKLFSRWLPFSPFESTVVSLLALVSAIVLATKVLSHVFGPLGHDARGERCDLCGGYHDTHDDDPADEDGEEVLKELLAPNEGLRAALFASGAVKPNSRCPCGSGRRYNKCCGDGRLFRQ